MQLPIKIVAKIIVFVPCTIPLNRFIPAIFVCYNCGKYVIICTRYILYR
jgi:hypothetical protein